MSDPRLLRFASIFTFDSSVLVSKFFFPIEILRAWKIRRGCVVVVTRKGKTVDYSRTAWPATSFRVEKPSCSNLAKEFEAFLFFLTYSAREEKTLSQVSFYRGFRRPGRWLLIRVTRWLIGIQGSCCLGILNVYSGLSPIVLRGCLIWYAAGIDMRRAMCPRARGRGW